MKFHYPQKVRDDFLKEIVSPMIKRRHELKMTQEILNHKLGVADSLVGKWECGMRTPLAYHLYCWADALEGRILFVPKTNILTISEILEKGSNDNNQV
jgi:transcriptional regulator with XRE-family HTH domain